MIAVLAAVVVAAVVWAAVDEPGDESRSATRDQQPDQQERHVPGVLRVLSRPDLKPPIPAIDESPARPGAGLIFVSPRLRSFARDSGARQQGALALDEQGRVVWFRPAGREPVTDVRVQEYRGEPVLTWWQGAASKIGIGRGEGVIVDERYRKIATVRAGNGYTADLHEFLLTPRGTALLTIYSRARRDLRAIGGLENAQVTEGIVQEVDVATGRVLFEWHSLDHVDPSESHREVPTEPDQSYDYFHINSVEEDAEGDLLISARHTSGVYKVDRETGEVIWRLGGKKSDFRMGRGTEFGIQHDARELGDGILQIFDNAAEEKDGQEPSSVKRLRLDTRRMRATLDRRFSEPDDQWSESQGNAQALDDGGVLAGWGSTGAFSRFDARGRVVFDAHLPAEYDSYRAYLSEWRGRPDTRPAIHARRNDQQLTVSASWNGATEVRRWQVLAGPGPDALEPLGRPVPWRGLETTIIRATKEPHVAVAALDRAGRTLGTSAVRRP